MKIRKIWTKPKMLLGYAVCNFMLMAGLLLLMLMIPLFLLVGIFVEGFAQSVIDKMDDIIVATSKRFDIEL